MSIMNIGYHKYQTNIGSLIRLFMSQVSTQRVNISFTKNFVDIDSNLVDTRIFQRFVANSKSRC